jgi:molybdenum cofactor cytidylyltransferase
MDGIIVAAGLSSRMGNFKPLLKYNGKTFLENIISNLDLICDKIVIVTGYNSEKINENIYQLSNDIKNKIEVNHNSHYESGMFTSLQKGLEKCNSNWIIYHFIDQPNLPKVFYEKFSQQIKQGYDWLQPVNNGQKGHPIIFNKKIRDKILNADTNSTLRTISASKKINKYFWECNFVEILSDFDYPTDLKKLS